jgi:hypothetical protein
MGPCDRYLSEFKNWRYSQFCWYFRPSFVNCCDSNLLFDSLPPPPSPLSLCEQSIKGGKNHLPQSHDKFFR